MNTTIHVESKGGFTLSEVMLAVGVVAFGLVAVFTILPFGLTAQKDNREETIVRYEAEYWFAALQAGGQKLEEMHRVDTIELKDKTNTIYRINRYDYDPDPSVTNEFVLNLSGKIREDWYKDVCGWLSAPDYVWDIDNPTTQKPRVKAKYARVWAINGPLFDRLYSPRHRGGHFLTGGEFSFGYLLKSKVEPLQSKVEPEGPSVTRITLKFWWPITGPVENALSPKSPVNPNGGRSIDSIVNPDNPLYDPEKLPPPPNEKEFSILTNLRPRPALSDANLNLRQRRIMKAGSPGDNVTFAYLDDMFPDRNSWEPWDGFERRVKFTDQNLAGIWAYNPSDNKLQKFENWNPAAGELQMMLSHPDDLGWYLQVLRENDYMREFYYQIIGIHALDNLDFAFFGGAIPPKYWNEQFHFKISFLEPGETWKDLLSVFQGQGLGRLFVDPDTGEDKWEFGSIHNSIHYKPWPNPLFGFFKIIEQNGAGVPDPQPARFSLTLEPDDYYPFVPPTTGTSCSFWFLR